MDQATHQEVLAPKTLRSDQNENLVAEWFGRGRKNKPKNNVTRDQEMGKIEILCSSKTKGMGQGQVWVRILALSFSGCVALGKFFQLSVPQFPHL